VAKKTEEPGLDTSEDGTRARDELSPAERLEILEDHVDQLSDILGELLTAHGEMYVGATKHLATLKEIRAGSE
jgi:hypothetical protein